MTLTLERRTMLRVALCSIVAMAFSTILYKYTTRAWFQQDDFAWLGLKLRMQAGQSFWHVMFAPMAQGTIRPLSERAFFMAFWSWFGYNAVPYRILVYVTQLCNIALLSGVSYRLTKSTVAAFLAPVLWIATIALAQPMTWTAAYNYILLSFFMLLAFHALLRFTETGEPRFNYLQWGSFLLGFGALEENVVYPAIAIVYAALFAPRYVKKTSLLVVPSVAYAAIHIAVRIPQRNDVYALYFDGSMISTLIKYWKRALGPGAAAEAFPQFQFPLVLTILLSLAVLSFVAVEYRRGDRLPVFFLGWFLIAITPFLPVRNHLSDYCLTIPVIGLALLGAWAAIQSPRRSTVFKIATGLSIAVYLACSIPATRKLSRDIWARSIPVKRLVLGVKAIHEKDPGKTIVLEGVNEALFWNAVYNHPFRLIGANDVYLTPDTVQKILPYPELGNVADFTLSHWEINSGLAQNRVFVYRVEEDGQLKDITRIYDSAAVRGELPTHIALGHPPMESLLGPTWFPSEGDYRWMPKEATVTIGIPEAGRVELHVEAFCVPVQLTAGPLELAVEMNGARFPPAHISDCRDATHLRFRLDVPPGTHRAEVKLTVNRTIRVPPDTRDLGLPIRTIEMLPRP